MPTSPSNHSPESPKSDAAAKDDPVPTTSGEPNRGRKSQGPTHSTAPGNASTRLDAPPTSAPPPARKSPRKPIIVTVVVFLIVICAIGLLMWNIGKHRKKDKHDGTPSGDLNETSHSKRHLRVSHLKSTSIHHHHPHPPRHHNRTRGPFKKVSSRSKPKHASLSSAKFKKPTKGPHKEKHTKKGKRTTHKSED